MQTCNPAKITTNNGISLESLKSSKGQSVMPTTEKVTPIRGDDLTLIDNKQAADILGVNYLTLQNWRARAKAPVTLKLAAMCVIAFLS